MIRATVLYPNKPDAKFDLDYYVNKHMKMVSEKFAPFGLVKAEVEKGIGGMQAGSPPPYVAMGSTVFNSIDDLQRASMAHANELMADLPNFTNIEPQMQVSEIVM